MSSLPQSNHKADPGQVAERLNLPGFTLQDLLVRGEFTVVYQGVRDADEAPVAIKTLLPSAPAGFKQQFQTGCGIHENLRHTSIIPLMEYGPRDSASFVVTPYLSHGTLRDQLVRGLSAGALFKYIKDVALALHYLHLEGYVHGDVKPENILFSVENKAYLADFDLARETHPDAQVAAMADDATATARPNNTDLLHVTPEYVAPELAGAKDVDGRADLYSLGVVLYHMLVGDLPYQGSSAAETAQKHLQEPIPRLPSHLTSLQPLLERVLAKRPEQRYQTGQEFTAAIDKIRQGGTLPVPTLRTAEISTREIRAISDDELLATAGDPMRTERQRQQMRKRKGLRAMSVVSVLLIATGVAGFYYEDQGLAQFDRVMTSLGLGDDPQLTSAWNDAQSLRQDPNQGLAAIAAAYRRVLAVVPGHPEATQELAALASDWKASIADALVTNELELAETKLAEAGSVFPNDLEWVQLSTELTDRERAERIIANTASLLTSHGLSDLPSATAAIQSYQEVLRLAPGHPAATEALRELGIHYADLASAAANRGEVNAAISMLERATAADRSLASLDDARKLISQATTTQTAIEELLQQARRLRSQGALIGLLVSVEEEPASESAAELYHRVLAIDTDNVIAQQGLVEITSQVAATADQLLANGELVEVEDLVNRAAAASLDEVGVAEMRRRLSLARNRQQAVAENLLAARALMEDGLLTAPPGDNAVARLREVQQIDPGNLEADQMLRACADRLATVAEEAHSVALLDDAKQYLDLALAIVPDVPEWIALRDSWEQVD